MPAISVIAGTYNYLRSLQRCLYSLERQTFRDFEVIIADDGSGPEIGEWLSTYDPGFRITHLWQEDRGFRKCRILNRAISCAAADYLVFIDADCILSRDFLHEHWTHREKGVFLGGRRVMICREMAERIGPGMIRRGYFDGFTWWGLYHSITGRMRYFDETFRFLHYPKKKRPFNLLGCNFSIHKSDLLRVNGFDEEYETRGGGEDTDIALRLTTAGCEMKSVRYLAVQFHLGHEIAQSKSLSERLFLKKKRKLKRAADAAGIRSSLNEKQDGVK